LSIQSRLVEYGDGNTPFEEGKAKDLAELGYVGTLHAFTNPAANDTERGTVYDAQADKRSWIAMKNFLAEVFKNDPELL